MPPLNKLPPHSYIILRPQNKLPANSYYVKTPHVHLGSARNIHRDKWTEQWKLALLAKEGIQLENLLNDPPSTVTYPPEPTYEEPVENHTQATERDRKVRNQQLKVNWQNRRKKVDEIGILCGDKPWGICKQKTILLLYLSIGTEGRRIFRSKHPHFQIEKQPFKELWQAMEDSFTKVRNITYDCIVFYSCKQQKGESV